MAHKPLLPDMWPELYLSTLEKSGQGLQDHLETECSGYMAEAAHSYLLLTTIENVRITVGLFLDSHLYSTGLTPAMYYFDEYKFAV